MADFAGPEDGALRSMTVGVKHGRDLDKSLCMSTLWLTAAHATEGFMVLIIKPSCLLLYFIYFVYPRTQNFLPFKKKCSGSYKSNLKVKAIAAPQVQV